MLKVSDQADQLRKEDEAAAKQANRGKKKNAKKVKTRRVVEEIDIQTIMLDMFQVLLRTPSVHAHSCSSTLNSSDLFHLFSRRLGQQLSAIAHQ